MSRAHWKGYISFGLVSIPVFLIPTDQKSELITFHQIDKRNNARIKYQKINAKTGEVVNSKDIIKGYEYNKDTMIPVPNKILNKISGENGKTIEITQFIHKNELNLITIEGSYYIVPDKEGEKGYLILREALAGSEKIAIARVIISTREYLAAILPYSINALVLCLLKYDKEMRNINEINFPMKENKNYTVNKKEIVMAKQLINSMSSKWNPEEYADEYQKKIHQWADEIARNIPHKFIKKSKMKVALNIIDFVDLLKKSLVVKPKKSKISKRVKHIPKPKVKSYKHVTRH